MFTTLHVSSLEQLDANVAKDYSLKTISPVTGKPKRVRSKMGCFYCRARKRKCDEIKPNCTFCSLRNLECVYPVEKESRKRSLAEPTVIVTNESNLTLSDRVTSTLVAVKSPKLALPFPIIEDNVSLLEYYHGMLRLPKVEELDEEGNAITSSDDVAEFIPNFLIEPSDMFSLYMDEQSMNFVSYFHRVVVNFVSITPFSIQNHLGNTYMSLAAKDQSILALLATWGALFVDGPESDTYKSLLVQARMLAHQKLESDSLSYMDKFVLLCYFSGLTGVEICSGETSEWHKLLQVCHRLVEELGSIRGLLERFHYLNEARYIVANLQYHEVMSSMSLKNGTFLKMSEYSAVFEDDTDFSYGVDPLQGCIHPVFLLLGEIINVKAEHVREAKEIEDELEGIAGTSPEENEQFELLTQKRLRHYFKASRIASQLMARVDACEPKQNQQCFISEEELEDHLVLFEAFRNTCKLQILIYIQSLRPKAPEVQLILVDTFKLIDVLIRCRLRSAISMVLLICGLCCCFQGDRVHLKKQFEEMQTYYKVHNVKKIQILVEHSWVINPNGDMTVNWEDLCEEFGWVLAAS